MKPIPGASSASSNGASGAPAVGPESATSASSHSLADLTTFRIGGPVDAVVEAPLADALAEIAGPVLVLGGGSNILASDSGFSGTVIRDSGRQIIQVAPQVLQADSGVLWDDLVAEAVGMGLGGIEALSGIPGTVGAAPVQNIGAYGAEVADVLESVQIWDRQARRQETWSAADLGLSYRDSVLKRSIRQQAEADPSGRWIVLSIQIRLLKGQSAPVRYKELAAHLDVPVGAAVDPTSVRDAVLHLRRSKGMVLDASDRDTWSAGSFFTNPVVDVAPEGAPAFAAPGGVKTSAAWLIQHAGFERGFTLDGRAALSHKHVLALTNRGDASAADVIRLAQHIQSGVRQTFGIELRPEPVLVGVSL